MTLSRLDRAAMVYCYALARRGAEYWFEDVCYSLPSDDQPGDWSSARGRLYRAVCELQPGDRVLRARLALLLRVLLRDESEAYELRLEPWSSSTFARRWRPKRYRALWEDAPAFDPAVTPKMRRGER